MNFRKVFVGFAFLLTALSGFAPEAYAHNDKNAEDAHSGNDSGTAISHANAWTTDGCSAIEDRGSGYNFNHACDHHDGCYRGTWASRLSCDKRFLENMRSSCKHDYSWYQITQRSGCYAWSTLFYEGVRRLGARSYRNGYGSDIQ